MLACRRLARPAFSRIRSLSTTTEGALTHENCDVVVVGGGPVGLALAGALSSSRVVGDNLRIALVEAGDLDKIRAWQLPSEKYSNRVSSLTNTSYAFLNDIGAWSYVQHERTCPVEHMDVWDGISDARISFDAAEIGTVSQNEGMARLTENLNLQRGLLHLLEKAPGVDLIHRTKVTSVTRESEGHGAWPIVNLDNGRRLRARLLVGADGFNSPVRAYAQIPSFGWSYDTQGVVATLIHRPRSAYEGPNTTAYQRFLPTGPIAFLPLSPTVSSLVWSTRPHIAQTLQGCDPSVLACMINAAFRLPQVSLQYLYNRISEAQATSTPLTPQQVQEEILWRETSHGIDRHSAMSASAAMGDAPIGIPPVNSELVPPLVTSIQAGSIASFPLRFNHTESYLGEGAGARTVLVGDAAHTIHPLAGQGLNLGLGDVEALAKCIENAILQGSDVGSYTALQPYARERYLTNHTIMAAIDKLHKLYTTDFEPVVWARSTGLEVVNELDSLKAAIMMTAGADGGKSGITAGWDMVTKGVETLDSAVKVARAVGGGIGGIVGTGVQTLIQRVSERTRA
ncbi:ubiquinone biosynthesis hydrox [Macrolepiota fuliginosa MF-IS2]|uniref:Ubiquinone biosynthesis monooxygenase COQ6, mitochondrial n=1 Tax=Macrolepiota fuliginosa MF-IS2 TaxID=1400762 RepID=A0A9P6C613_9AGAR|nr:ubiquinone biosynthesis hydrox [Macrolepiota fuliginosa MF-IS2]